MKVSIRQLRNAVRQALAEIKLGIADANPPGEAWGTQNPEEFDIEKIGRILGRPNVATVPDPETLDTYRSWEKEVQGNANYDWDDDKPKSKKLKKKS